MCYDLKVLHAFKNYLDVFDTCCASCLTFFVGILKVLHKFVAFTVTEFFLDDQPLCIDVAVLL